jgi:hypothetical protein
MHCVGSKVPDAREAPYKQEPDVALEELGAEGQGAVPEYATKPNPSSSFVDQCKPRSNHSILRYDLYICIIHDVYDDCAFKWSRS